MTARKKDEGRAWVHTARPAADTRATVTPPGARVTVCPPTRAGGVPDRAAAAGWSTRRGKP